ncbi:MAG: hypothetical protein ABR611_10825 [Chthoniobacterales bacterium]
MLTILVATTVALRAEAPVDAIRAMVEAERKFYQTGQEKGTRAAATGIAQSLEEARNAFIATAKLDFTKAFRQFGSEAGRLYRNGSFPTIGKKDGVELLGPEQAGITMEVMNGEMSSTSDLAYDCGKYSDGRTAGGYFLQIWQTNAVGAWQLVLDWQQPRPFPR